MKVKATLSSVGGQGKGRERKWKEDRASSRGQKRVGMIEETGDFPVYLGKNFTGGKDCE